jgi:hypothetical protein
MHGAWSIIFQFGLMREIHIGPLEELQLLMYVARTSSLTVLQRKIAAADLFKGGGDGEGGQQQGAVIGGGEEGHAPLA